MYWTNRYSHARPSPTPTFHPVPVGLSLCLEAQLLHLVPEPLDELVSTTEAAQKIGVGKSTISNWAQRGYLAPADIDAAHRPLYKMIDVLRAARDTRRRAIGQNRTA